MTFELFSRAAEEFDYSSETWKPVAAQEAFKREGFASALALPATWFASTPGGCIGMWLSKQVYYVKAFKIFCFYRHNKGNHQNIIDILSKFLNALHLLENTNGVVSFKMGHWVLFTFTLRSSLSLLGVLIEDGKSIIEFCFKLPLSKLHTLEKGPSALTLWCSRRHSLVAVKRSPLEQNELRFNPCYLECFYSTSFRW